MRYEREEMPEPRDEKITPDTQAPVAGISGRQLRRMASSVAIVTHRDAAGRVTRHGGDGPGHFRFDGSPIRCWLAGISVRWNPT